MKCTSCGKEIANDSSTCMYCGANVKEIKVCPSCGVMCDSDHHFCPACGYDFVKNLEISQRYKVKKEVVKVVEKQKGHGVLFVLLGVLISVLIGMLVLLWALKSGRVEITIHSPKDNTENTEIQVDEKLLTVEITIPADIMKNVATTQEELDAIANTNGYKSIKLNPDGSATYTLTKAQHREMMKGMRINIDNSIQETLSSNSFPSITNIEHNDDYTTFAVTTTSSEVQLDESMCAIQLYLYGGMYNAFNATPVDNIHVDYVNADSGETIASSDSSEIGE